MKTKAFGIKFKNILHKHQVKRTDWRVFTVIFSLAANERCEKLKSSAVVLPNSHYHMKQWMFWTKTGRTSVCECRLVLMPKADHAID